MTFNVGDTVRCVDPSPHLVINGHYVIANAWDNNGTLLVQVEGIDRWLYVHRFVSLEADIPPPEATKKIVLNEKAKRPVVPKPKTTPPTTFSNSLLWSNIKEKIPQEHRSSLFHNLLEKWHNGKITHTAPDLDRAFTWSGQPEGSEFWTRLHDAVSYNVGFSKVNWEKLYD